MHFIVCSSHLIAIYSPCTNFIIFVHVNLLLSNTHFKVSDRDQYTFAHQLLRVYISLSMQNFFLIKLVFMGLKILRQISGQVVSLKKC